MSESIVPHLNKPISKYNGEDITCYPSSNATDEGKLNLEFNMARFVTRISSKNFCIVKPSFDMEIVTDSTTREQVIRVGTGQASINGMDLIMTNTITIEPPEEAGKYYLAFHLERDSSANVEGDTIYGVSRIFGGISLRYYTEKVDPLPDMDLLYIGSLYWNGSEFSELEEDEDKYGRIWAEDVLGKFLDPKHPDVRRLNLQEWIYNVPDWYFSKEGDICYGPITIADNRVKNNPGIIINVDEHGSYITIKDPAVDNNLLQLYGDINRDGVIDQADLDLVNQIIDGTYTPTELEKILADVNHDSIIDEKDALYISNFIKGEGNAGDTGNIYYIDDSVKQINITYTDGTAKMEIEKADIYESEDDDVLHIHNDGDICIDAEGEIRIEADSDIKMSTESEHSPIVVLDDNGWNLTDPDVEDMQIDLRIFEDETPSGDALYIAQQILGQAIWQYEKQTQNVTLLQDNVQYLDIVPNGVFEQDLTVEDTLHIGPLLNQQTYLKQTEWQMQNANGSKTIKWYPSRMEMINTTLSNTDNSYILMKNTNNSIHTQIYDNAKIELLNGVTNPQINWKDGNVSYDVTLEKIIGEKRLNLQGNLTVTANITAQGLITGMGGLKTGNGILTFSRGTNDATIIKDNNSSNLRTNGNVYIGSSGEKDLYAGNGVFQNSLGVGGDSYANSEFKIDSAGNVNTSGTITGSRVYNAVYNDYAEIFRKNKDEKIEYGDIVCIKEDGLVHKVSSNDDMKTIIGICSDTPGVVLGGKDIPEEEQVVVGMVGQIWVKTDNEKIRPGQVVKALPNGKVDLADNMREKLGITLTNVEKGKVKIVYNG